MNNSQPSHVQADIEALAGVYRRVLEAYFQAK